MRLIFLSIFTLISVAALGVSVAPQSVTSDRSAKCSMTIEGELDKQVLQDVKNLENCGNITVQISSIGGEGLLSLEIARNLQNKDTTVEVNDYCISSCAEFILPAAKRVIFKARPLVGFHGNPAMKQYLANVMEPEGYENCSFKDADEMYGLYFETDINYEFWRTQLQKLELKSFGVEQISNKNACPKMGFNFRHEMWFPSSSTLQNDFNLKFEGSVCADRVDKCAKRVSQLFKGRGTFVVDDTVIDTLVYPRKKSS